NENFSQIHCAAGLSALLTLPASAQQFKGRGCDNVSTSRDKTPKPDSRCQHAAPDKYLDQQKKAYDDFLTNNQPKKAAAVQTPKGTVIVLDGVDGNGVPHRIVSGPGGYAGSGSAPQINVGNKRNGGSGGRTSAR